MKLPGLPYLLAGALAMGLGTGWVVRGWLAETAHLQHVQQLEAAAAKRRQAVQRRERELRFTIRDLSQRINDRRIERDVQIQTIEKEVIRYVTEKEPATTCTLDPRWVCLHNAAARGKLSGGTDATCSTDGATRGVTNAPGG